MSTLLRVTSFLSLAVLVACASSSPHAGTGVRNSGGAGGEGVPRTPLCDGSDALRLRFYIDPEPEREPPGSAVLIEHGYFSFALDGGCRYFVNGGATKGSRARYLPWRTGRLPAALKSALESVIDLERLEELSDCTREPGSSDGADLFISSQSSHASCDGSPQDTAFTRAWAIVSDAAPELYRSGTDMDGALRIAAVPGQGEPVRNLPWPLERPAANFLLKESEVYSLGVSSLVTEEGDVSKLRALRGTFLEQSAVADGSIWGDGVEVVDGAATYAIFLRDALPYEGTDGLWPF